MQITHTQTFLTPQGNRTISIELTDDDLTEEERHPALLPYRGVLLDLTADRQMVTAMFRLGLFHRKAEKNQKIAGERLAKIAELHKGIVQAAQ